MGSMCGGSCFDPRIPKIRAAIHAHYRRRGVPERKIEEMEYRWVRRNGWRAPQ